MVSGTLLLFRWSNRCGNLISWSYAFSKTSLNIWKFTAHVLLKPDLENFEHYFTSFWTVVLEKTLESPLDCKEIQPVHPKGDQSWVFIGRTDAEVETPILATSCEELTHWKRPWCWEGLGAGGEGDDRGWDGWMASLTRWTWVWVNSGSWWWTGRCAVIHVVSKSRTWLSNWTELNWTY